WFNFEHGDSAIPILLHSALPWMQPWARPLLLVLLLDSWRVEAENWFSSVSSLVHELHCLHILFCVEVPSVSPKIPPLATFARNIVLQSAEVRSGTHLSGNPVYRGMTMRMLLGRKALH